MTLLSRRLMLLIVLGSCHSCLLMAQRNEAMYPLRLSRPEAAVMPDFETGPSPQPGQISSGPALHIDIIDGEGAINNIKGRIATDIIVQVQDRDHRPVPGAMVTLISPSGGPSGTFAAGQHLVSLATDQDGRAVFHGFRANKISGKFQVKVTASFQGEVATGAITQTNIAMAAGAVAGGGAGLSAGVIGAIAGGVAAAVGAGVYLTHRGQSSPTVPSISIAQPGSATAGAPH